MSVDIAAALQNLTPFVGTWQTKGMVVATSAAFTATDIYEWLPGGHFLVHRWDAAMPDGRSQGIEIIGPDAPDGIDGAGDHYTMHSFDSTGKAETMRAVVNGKNVAYDGDGVRFRGAFNGDGSEMSGTWSLQAEGSPDWEPWMSVTLKRAIQVR
ncbi:MAG: hypothetical protein V4679_19250 [Pseudomonadota bacterium]